MRFILFLILLLPVCAFSQDAFYRNIDWKFIPQNVIRLTDSTYQVDAVPFDYNDPGAAGRDVGNYVVDFVGRRYLVTGSTSTVLFLLDEGVKNNKAPQSGQTARCYLSVGEGDYPYVGSVDYSPLDMSARWRLNGADNELLWKHGEEYEYPFKRLVLDTTYTPTGTEPTGTTYYDKENRTMSVALGNGVVMQVNQESLIKVHNGTTDTLEDGRILGYLGIIDGEVSVKYASNYERHIFLAASTERIPPDSIGLAVSLIGRVNNVNTGDLLVNPVYLDTAGYVTNEVPSFPKYNYPIGAVLKTGVTDGIIQFRSDQANYQNSIRNAFDGSIRESFDFRTYSDGINVYGVLTNPNGRDSLTLMFSDGWFDHTVPDTIQLIAGTTTDPQLSYVYIDKETRTLQTSTSAPTNDFEYAQIAKIALLDAASTQTYGALRNQNINNHLKSNSDNGHIVHIGDRVRVLNAQWEDGVGLTVSGTPTNLYLSTTSGNIWQMHLQSFAAQSMPTDDIHIANHPTTPYVTTSNLNTISVYSDGSTWNNEWQNLVIWGVGNKTGEAQHLMCNLSSDGYTSEEDAIEDRNNYASYVIPREFRGVGFLIARITVRRSPSGYTYNPSTGYLDLRGYYPNNTAGGGTGSSGITEFTQLDDTPSSYLGYGGYTVNVTTGEDGLEFVEPLDLSVYWRNDGTSTATGDWDIGSNDFSADVLSYTGGQLGGVITNSSTGLNLRTNTGFTSYSSGTSNSPITGSGSILTQRYGDFANQIAIPESFGYPRLFARSGYFGVYDAWFNWAEIITDQNISDFEADPIALDSINNNLRPDIDENTDSIQAISTRSLQNESDILVLETTKQDNISLTTTGTSGASTFITNTLNIPRYDIYTDDALDGLGFDGSLTSGYLPYWNGTALANSNAYYSGSNLLVGTTTDNGYKLDVNGTGIFRDKLTVDAGSFVSGNYLNVTDATNGADTRFGIFDGVNNDAIAGSWGVSTSFRLYANAQEVLRLQSNKNAIFYNSLTVSNNLNVNSEVIIAEGATVADAPTTATDVIRLEDIDGTGTNLDIVANSLDADAYYLSGSLIDFGSFAELVSAPSTSTSTGTAGQMAYDSDYFYICVATNTWKRVAISTW